MKKIIAVAVATAFTAPAMAAEVSLNGVIEYQYRDIDGVTTSAVNGDTPAFTVSATSETDAGYQVSGSMTWDGGWDDHSISVAGDFGKLSVGNPSGGLDAVGDYTDIAPEKGGFTLDGNDHFIAFSPNTGIENFAVHLSFNPATSDNGADAADEGHAVGASYTMGATQFYAGKEEYKGDSAAAQDTTGEWTAYGVKSTFGGLYVAYEAGSLTNTGADTSDVKFTGIAGKYTMGAVTIGAEIQDVDNGYNKLEQDGADSAIARFDRTTSFVSYNFGGGLSAYLEQSDEDVAGTDQTTAGIKYSF